MLEGLPPNGAAHMARLDADEATARAVVDIIMESYDPAETAAAAFEKDSSQTRWTTPLWSVEIYFGFAPDEDNVRGLVQAAAGEEAARALVFSCVAACDWVAASLAGLAPVRVERFLIHGAHDKYKTRANDWPIEIEAALAFGTGHHGTTRGCLQIFASLCKKRRLFRVLDVGTGTGVLAIAAARALRRPIASGDIDPIAVTAARSAAILNGAIAYVRPVISIGARHAHLRSGAPYDVIFANILARPLRRMAPELARLAAPNAALILSGLLAADVPGVLSVYAAQGFHLHHRLNLEGWASLLLRKGGAAPKRRQVFRRWDKACQTGKPLS